jgi:hypothetical protein
MKNTSHLDSAHIDEYADHIDSIAESLDEDIYGASGEFNDEQIRERLMQKIVERCNYHCGGSGSEDEDPASMSIAIHEFKPALSLSQAANLILGVWKHMAKQSVELLYEPPHDDIDVTAKIVNDRLAPRP